MLAATAVGLALVALFLLSRTAQNSEDFNRLHILILSINVIGVLVLFILLVGNLYRLLREYRTRELTRGLTLKSKKGSIARSTSAGPCSKFKSASTCLRPNKLRDGLESSAIANSFSNSACSGVKPAPARSRCSAKTHTSSQQVPIAYRPAFPGRSRKK